MSSSDRSPEPRKKLGAYAHESEFVVQIAPERHGDISVDHQEQGLVALAGGGCELHHRTRQREQPGVRKLAIPGERFT